TGEVAHLLTAARRLDVEPMDALLGGRARLAEVDQADRVREPAQRREDDVRLHVHPDREAVALAVLREIADAQMNIVRRAVDVRDLAVNANRSRVRAVRAEHRARDFGPTRADEPGEAEDLAAPKAEAHVAD